MTMERISKVIGSSPGNYNIDVDQAMFGGTDLHIWNTSGSNHDRILIKLTPEQAEELAASLLRFAKLNREIEQDTKTERGWVRMP